MKKMVDRRTIELGFSDDMKAAMTNEETSEDISRMTAEEKRKYYRKIDKEGEFGTGIEEDLCGTDISEGSIAALSESCDEINHVYIQASNEVALMENILMEFNGSSILVENTVGDKIRNILLSIRAYLKGLIKFIKDFIGRLTSGITMLELMYKSICKKLDKVGSNNLKIPTDLSFTYWAMSSDKAKSYLKSIVADLLKCMPSDGLLRMGFNDEYAIEEDIKNFYNKYSNIKKDDIASAVIIHGVKKDDGTIRFAFAEGDHEYSFDKLMEMVFKHNIGLASYIFQDISNCKPILDKMPLDLTYATTGNSDTLKQALQDVVKNIANVNRIFNLSGEILKDIIKSTSADMKKYSNTINGAAVKESYVNHFDILEYSEASGDNDDEDESKETLKDKAKQVTQEMITKLKALFNRVKDFIANTIQKMTSGYNTVEKNYITLKNFITTHKLGDKKFIFKNTDIRFKYDGGESRKLSDITSDFYSIGTAGSGWDDALKLIDEIEIVSYVDEKTDTFDHQIDHIYKVFNVAKQSIAGWQSELKVINIEMSKANKKIASNDTEGDYQRFIGMLNFRRKEATLWIKYSFKCISEYSKLIKYTLSEAKKMVSGPSTDTSESSFTNESTIIDIDYGINDLMRESADIEHMISEMSQYYHDNSYLIYMVEYSNTNDEYLDKKYAPSKFKQFINKVAQIIRKIYDAVVLSVKFFTNGYAMLAAKYKMLEGKLNKTDKMEEKLSGKIDFKSYTLKIESIANRVQDNPAAIMGLAISALDVVQGIEREGVRSLYKYISDGVWDKDVIDFDSNDKYSLVMSHIKDQMNSIKAGYIVLHKLEGVIKKLMNTIEDIPVKDNNEIAERTKAINLVNALVKDFSNGLKEQITSCNKAISAVNAMANGKTTTEENVNIFEDDFTAISEAFDSVNVLVREVNALLESTTYVSEALVKSSDDIYYNKEGWDSGNINLCFIVGLSGSGKSTMGSAMSKGQSSIEHYDMDDIVFNKQNHDLDWYKSNGDMAYKFFTTVGKNYFMNFKDLKDSSMSESDYRNKITNDFVKFAISYAKSHKNKKFIVEGVWLYRYISPSVVSPYAVCIKGTSAVTSMYRAGKRDNDYLDKIKKTGKLAIRDDSKLNRWRAAFKSSATNTTDNKKKVEPIAASAIIYPSYDSSFLYMAACEDYIEDCIHNETIIREAISMMTGNYILTEAEMKLTDEVRAKWTRFTQFTKRLFDRFRQNVERFIDKKWLDKYKDIILNVEWSSGTTFEYNGDYKTGIERCTSIKCPQFEYHKDAQWLRQNGYEGAVKNFMAGHNFKFDPEKKLAEQFKEFFLGMDHGQTKGKFSDLYKQAEGIFNFCYNSGEIMAKVQGDIDVLDKNTNELLNAVNQEMREKGENINQQQNINPTTNTTTNAGKPNNPTTPTQTNTTTNVNGNNNGSQTTKTESFWMSINEEENNQNNNGANQNTNNNQNNNNTPQTGITINNNQPKEVDNNGNAKPEDQKGKPNTTTEDIRNILNKETELCRSFYTAKLTAIQQIVKDYMAIMKAHVEMNTKKDKRSGNNNTNQQQQTNNNTQQQQNINQQSNNNQNGNKQ